MILRGIKYIRFEGEPREWAITDMRDEKFAVFGNLNLLVGKNASGKSRTLQALSEISDLIAGRHTIEQTTYRTESYDLIFADGSDEYRYYLSYCNRLIKEEWLSLNGKVISNRAEVIGLDSSTELLISRQELDLDKLRQWGLNLRSFTFSNQQEKTHLVKNLNIIEENNSSVVYPDSVIQTFYQGSRKFGGSFANDIEKCMQAIGYSISNIQINTSSEGYGLSVLEEGKYTILQGEMSNGMFRSLTLLIHLIYAQMSNLSIGVLLDDIGEGLDYDRSKELAKIVIKRINNSNIQIFMTTNDRNVMNKIPLKYWTIIDRLGKRSVFYNYQNSKQIYEDFKYTGLNNYDFFATDFYKKGFGSEESITAEIKE